MPPERNLEIVPSAFPSHVFHFPKKKKKKSTRKQHPPFIISVIHFGRQDLGKKGSTLPIGIVPIRTFTATFRFACSTHSSATD